MDDRFGDDDTDLLSSSAASTHPRTPRIFDRFDDSDSDFSPSSSSAAGKKLDYMIQFLDRKLSNTTTTSSASSLPEFIASGGGTGIFKLPVRGAVRADRPPSFEVRSRPLRETQIGCGLRLIMSTETQLWGGAENGVRVWEFSELFSADDDDVARRVGDEMTAPFRESAETAAEVTCMVEDGGGGVVWSGHKDGKIRCWRMKGRIENGFREIFSWQAHRGPVLSMVISAFGESLSLKLF